MRRNQKMSDEARRRVSNGLKAYHATKRLAQTDAILALGKPDKAQRQAVFPTPREVRRALGKPNKAQQEATLARAAKAAAIALGKTAKKKPSTPKFTKKSKASGTGPVWVPKERCAQAQRELEDVRTNYAALQKQYVQLQLDHKIIQSDLETHVGLAEQDNRTIVDLRTQLNKANDESSKLRSLLDETVSDYELVRTERDKALGEFRAARKAAWYLLSFATSKGLDWQDLHMYGLKQGETLRVCVGCMDEIRVERLERNG